MKIRLDARTEKLTERIIGSAFAVLNERAQSGISVSIRVYPCQMTTRTEPGNGRRPGAVAALRGSEHNKLRESKHGWTWMNTDENSSRRAHGKAYRKDHWIGVRGFE